jgi:hypothetical protein
MGAPATGVGPRGPTWCQNVNAMEPEALRRGKEFHRLVQTAWAGEISGAAVRPEHTIFLQSIASPATHQRRGRLDIFVGQIGDFVSVIEIKSTDWDRVVRSNRRRLLAAHRRQVLKYVDQYLDHDHVNVCAGIIYPKAPSSIGLQSVVEQYLNDHGLQVVWYLDP